MRVTILAGENGTPLSEESGFTPISDFPFSVET
jgi:hypothetical protein